MKKVLLIDDHVLIRSGVKIILSDICRDCEIYEAVDEASALEKLKEHTYTFIMLDVQMPNTDSFSLMKYINVNYPSTNVLVFSMSAENIFAGRFLKAGAKGFISKQSTVAEIKKAILTVMDNKNYVSDAMVETLVNKSYLGSPVNPFNKLSEREFEIASLLLSGQTITEISKSLTIKISTAGTYKARVFEKMGAKNLLDLKELATLHKL